MARRKKDRVKKSNKKLLKRMQIKLWVVFGGICVLFVFLIGKLMYIEYTSGSKYEKIVLSQQKYDSAIVPYQRGDIIDSKGSVLATSVDVYNVILDCKVLNANTDLIDTTVNEGIKGWIMDEIEEVKDVVLQQDYPDFDMSFDQYY